MDSSPPPSSSSPESQKWLAFSLPDHFPSSSTHSSLFPSFSSPTPSSTVPGRADDVPPEEPDATVGVGGGATSLCLSIFTGGPKLEDFLGGPTATTCSTAPPPPLPQLSTGNMLTVSDNEIYDSELKTIAASFLRGFAATTKQAEPQKRSLAPSESPPKKAVDTFGQRTSIYRGVTRHRWTGRYEAHLWDNSCRREGQSRKGRQVYLGGYDKEEKAAKAYDLAALKYWGPTTTTNFPISNYEKELEEMRNMSRQEFVASLRRKSSGFSRGASIYRGVTRHHQHGRWQARIGRVAGNKDLYLGTFSTQEEAAEAYDIAAIKFRGLNAVTNFDMSRYDVKSIANSNLPIGGFSAKAKNSNDSQSETITLDGISRSDDRDPSSSSSLTFASQPTCSSTLSFAAIPIKQDPSENYWSNILGLQSPYLKNPSFTNGFASQTSNTTPLSMDFGESNNVYSNVGVLVQQQSGSSGSSSTLPLATPITLNSNNGYENSNSSGYGNWIGSSVHTFQAHAKSSLFQTAIFGME